MTDNTKSKPEVVTCKLKPCGCGCNGGDYWHRNSFRRVVRNVVDESGTRLVRAYTLPQQYRRCGQVQLPWGMVDVVDVVHVLQDGRECRMGWFVAVG